MTTRRVKVVITGYYEVNMDHALEDYGTTDPLLMLQIDKENTQPEIALDQLAAEDVSIKFDWVN